MQSGIELRPGGTGSAAADTPAAPSRRPAEQPSRSFLIGAVGNLSVQYNLSCLAIAVACLTAPPLPSDLSSPALIQPAWAKRALFGVAFAGAMAGMVAMGYVGDRIGRRRGMILTLAFVVAGALGAAVLTWGDADTFFGLLCAWRLVLGFGVGGIYPMAAATAHESNGPGDAEDAKSQTQAAVRVGWVFFWQAPGAALPYLLAVCLTFLAPTGVAWAAGAEFRLVVGFGGAIAAVPLIAAYYSQEPATSKAAADDRPNRTLRKGQGVYAPVPTGDTAEADDASALGAAPHSSPDVDGAVPLHQSPWLTLLGTGGAWFLYDVVLYSTSLFTPQIIESIFGRGEGAVAIAWESLFVTLFGIPACAAAIWALQRRGGRWLSIWGFVFIAVAFAGLAAALTAFPASSDAAAAKFALLCAVTVALNAGPNVSTYVLPASAFRRSERGFFHGLSAAAGKAGAVLGAFVFPALLETVGLAGVLWMQVGVALLGAVVSVVFLRAEP